MSLADHLARVEVDGAPALWDWLGANHGQSESVWLVTFKKHCGARYLSTGDVLDALIAYGWIDGRRRKLDDDRTMQLISPRQQQAWAESYKLRAARLIEEGRMQPPGHATIEAGKASGLWLAMADVDALLVPEDLSAALAKAQNATAYFEGYPKGYKRNVLRWLKQAKRAETRAKRLAEITRTAAQNARIPQM